MITATRPPLSPPSNRPSPPVAEPPRREAPSQHFPEPDHPIHELASTAVGVISGLASGFSRVVVGGCAGAAQGLIKGVDLKDEQARIGFKVAMGANLAVTGALAGGIAGFQALALSPAEGALAGAYTNLMVGQSQWEVAPADFQTVVRTRADAWTQKALDQLPANLAQDPGLGPRLARGGLGNLVGLAAGVYTGASQALPTFRDGYTWGVSTFEKASDWLTPPPPEKP